MPGILSMKPMQNHEDIAVDSVGEKTEQRKEVDGYEKIAQDLHGFSPIWKVKGGKLVRLLW
jgi:hypothetical protein